ncbi:MAG: hypothetical protein RIK87_10540 [Fuerstiella sp.]
MSPSCAGVAARSDSSMPDNESIRSIFPANHQELFEKSEHALNGSGSAGKVLSGL